MARKIVNYKVTDEGRDHGKTYVLTEMSAAQGEWWATRVLLAVGNAVDLPENFEDLGMAGVAELGLRAISNLDPDVVKPLLDEMFKCVEFMPDPKSPQITRELMTDTDIEEVMTRMNLRVEIWTLNMGFLSAVMSSLPAKADGLKRKRNVTRISQK